MVAHLNDVRHPGVGEPLARVRDGHRARLEGAPLAPPAVVAAARQVDVLIPHTGLLTIECIREGAKCNFKVVHDGTRGDP